ncbi:DEAD/DEAH box helicase [Bdellovibrio sp. SKB1291214]|uniref:DEAD/DEAH box helicase n=1 Tax=Bdellovibrio sp. SKB1291214 TaxID=1732569 RepID=UPI000B5157F6|nr:DEAD/DEAH box helicase [Bdellovibrio sp. SKB1291214]UYL09130.1 DEAD/DEAH box helicase [Bdellovibrio sp. SKB1291214]
MTSSQKFSDLPLVEPIQRAVAETGYTTPTPIQQQAIPYLLEGRDLLGCAQTGTGKTAAFALPILNHLAKQWNRAEPKHARVLVLAPTRELAIQIHESFQTYGKHLKIRTAVIFGGVGQTPQVKALSSGVDVLIATPGRLLDLIQQKYLKLDKLEVFVLDEADRMLDMGFLPDIRKVLTYLPKLRQNLFFSATMPKEIQKLADSLLVNPAKVEVAPVSSTAEMIEQSVMFVDKSKKRDLLRHLLDDKSFDKVIVFTRTKHGANRVAEGLAKNRIPAEAIHGNKSQNARQRSLENLREGKIRVLVATDIAARGIDIDGISHVINFELPNESESYVHRIGRTARAGTQGVAIAFCDAEERAYLRDIERLIGKSIPVVTDQPYHSEEVAGSKILSKGKAKAMIEAMENRPTVGGFKSRRRLNPRKKPPTFEPKGGGANADASKASASKPHAPKPHGGGHGNGPGHGPKKSGGNKRRLGGFRGNGNKSGGPKK